MSHQLINHSADLKLLVDEGYAVGIENGHLIIDEIPYVDALRRVRRGTFICPLDANSHNTVPPQTHVMYFSGEYPCNPQGMPLEILGKTSPPIRRLGARAVQHAFSNKPKGPQGPRPYRDFYEKVTTYTDILLSAAVAIDAAATAKVGALPSIPDDAPFTIPDSGSARSGTTDLADVFRQEVISLVGLGGTGSYILDHLCKTPFRECRLFDGDRFYPHNAFRAPGAPMRAELQPPPFKVDYYVSKYSHLKNGLQPHPVAIDANNLHLVEGSTFAFVSMDACPAKALLINKLEDLGVSFIEVGMGLHKTPHGIGGTLRAVLSTPQNRDEARRHIPLEIGGKDRVYTNNIQLSDLNSMNANFAIQMWKAYRGFYLNFAENIWTYQLDTRTLIREAA